MEQLVSDMPVINAVPKVFTTSGQHIICDAHGCENVAILNNKDQLVELLKTAADKSKMKLVGTSAHAYEPIGVTAIAIVEESSLSIHTYPEHKYASLDLYTCGTTSKPELGLKYMLEVLKPQEVNAECISRGNIKNLEMAPLVTKKKVSTFGYELLLDFYDCRSADDLNNLTFMYDFLDKLVDNIGMEKQAPPFIFRTDEKKYPDKAGLSGWVALVESGIQVHTIVPNKFLTLDLYSCRNFDCQKVIEFVSQVFKPKKVNDQFLLRGVEFK